MADGKGIYGGGILNRSIARHCRGRKSLALSDRITRGVLTAVMILLSLTYVFMFLWLLCNSFRTSGDYTLNSMNIFDFSGYTFENYITAFSEIIAGSNRNPVYLLDTIINTLVVVIGQTLLAITIPALTGYIIAKYRFKGRNLLLNIAVVSMIVPTLGSLSTTYSLILSLNLLNNYFGVFLLSAGGFGFGFLLFRNFFAAIPWDYAESAFLDGATDMQVFIRIMYPQAVPILTAIAITTFINCWNDYYTAYIYLPELPTISLGVSQLYSMMEARGLLPVAFAGMTVLSVVSLAVFACFSKLIMNNVSAGGIKA